MPFVEIYISSLLADCEHRAFVLKAVGIDHVVGQRGDAFVLLVPEQAATAAIDHLRRYDEESRPAPPRLQRRMHSNAWHGSIVFAIVLLAVAWCAGEDVGNLNWFEVGALTRAAAHGRETWRLITALTLHADVAHLIANLAFGVPYGYFASQLLGSGRAWLSTLAAATLANGIDSAVMTTHQVSIGASTAVFALLGLVAAYAWRTESSGATRWAHRFSPLVAAVALLALTGVGGERTDVVAHLAGFFCGAVVGTLQSLRAARALERQGAQNVAAILAFAVVTGAWLWALSSQARA
jgi:membrane associated rhomboid family serine protease